MARTETTRVTYETLLCDGIAEVPDDSPDEPWRIELRRVTETIVRDGRGRNYQAGQKASEKIADLTVEQAAGLITSLANDLAFTAEVGARRVLGQ